MPLRSTTCRRGVAFSRSTLSAASSSERGCADRSCYGFHFSKYRFWRPSLDVDISSQPDQTMHDHIPTPSHVSIWPVRFGQKCDLIAKSLISHFFVTFSRHFPVIYQFWKTVRHFGLHSKFQGILGGFFPRRLRIQSRSIQDILLKKYSQFSSIHTFFSIFFCNLFYIWHSFSLHFPLFNSVLNFRAAHATTIYSWSAHGAETCKGYQASRLSYQVYGRVSQNGRFFSIFDRYSTDKRSEVAMCSEMLTPHHKIHPLFLYHASPLHHDAKK